MNYIAAHSFGERNARKTHVIATVFLMLIHTVFLVLFAFMGVKLLVIVNLVLIVIYAFSAFLIHRGYFVLSASISHILIISYSLLNVLIFGWGFGFEYYIFGLFVLLFFDSKSISKVAYFVSFFEFLLFIGLYFYTKFYTFELAKGVLPHGVEQWQGLILTLNLLIVCLFLTVYQNLFNIDADVRLIELNTQRNYYEKLANYDSLTGILNRQSFSEIIKKRYENDYPLKTAVLVIDIDFFKQINDRFGHDRGDSVLMQVASILSSIGGDSNLVCRWGGEEFVMDVYDVFSSAQLQKYADYIISSVLNHNFEGIPERISVSIGGCFSSHINLSEAEYFSMLHTADLNLYECKTSGRGMAKASDFAKSE